MKKYLPLLLSLLVFITACGFPPKDLKGTFTIQNAGNMTGGNTLANACIMNPLLNPQDIVGTVYTSFAGTGALYIGGQFTVSGVTTRNIVKWNGSSWTGMGNTLIGGFINPGEVRTINSYNNEIYAGGNFNGNIKKWNGSSWQNVGTGVNSKVWASAIYNGELYIGGDFTTAGGAPANHIAKWNGTSWSAVGSGVNGSVRSLQVYNNTLFAGGSFSTSGTGNTVNNLSQFDGTNWSNVSNGVDGIVSTMKVYNNELILGGQFLYELTSNTYVRYMARYNGAGIVSFPFGGTTGIINDFTLHNGELYAAGGLEFGTVNINDAVPVAVNRISKWDSNTQKWIYLQNDINGIVYTLASFGKLIVGGAYNSCNQANPNIPNRNIAKWGL